MFKKYFKFVVVAASLFAAPLSSRLCAQIDKDLTARTTALEEIGVLKNFNSNQIKSSIFGVGFECLDRKMFDPSKYYDKLASLGVKWARCQTGWNRTETQKGKYDFAWLDDVVDNMLARGVQPWFNVGYGNRLYMKDANNPTAVGYVPIFYDSECLQAWKNYVRALAKHFKGRVNQFEIWNEPNVKTFWRNGNAKDVSGYSKLIVLTAAEIKAEIPDAKIGACIAGMGEKYFSQILDGEAAKILDFFSVHPYSMVPELNYVRSVNKLKKLAEKKGAGQIAIRQGEVGYPVYISPSSWVGKGSWYKSDEHVQAKWMLRRFLLDIEAGVDLTSFFMITDFNDKYALGEGAPKEAVWGMIANGGAYGERKVCGAMRNFCSLFSEGISMSKIQPNMTFNEDKFPVNKRISRFMSELPQITCKAFERKGKPVYVYFIAEDLQCRMRTFEALSLKLDDGAKALQKPILIDLINGKVYRANSGFNELPITDYPLVIAEESAIDDLILKNNK